MNSANFKNTGQLSFTQDVLDFLQNAYTSAIAALSGAIGGNAILSGCVVNNGTRSAGIILFRGEVLPFAGGNDLAYFDVQDVVGQRPYYDGSNKDFTHTRSAIMTATPTATSAAAAQFAQIKTLSAFSNLPTVWSDDYKATPAAGTLATLQALNAAIAAIAQPAGIPSGAVMMWAGAVANIPTGWALCNGQNGTPDLRNKFVLGSGDKYAVGATGGEETHILSKAELPNIDAAGNTPSSTVAPGGRGFIRKSVAGENDTINSTDSKGSGAEPDISSTGILPLPALGSGQAHNNMPPYYALAFIMKL